MADMSKLDWTVLILVLVGALNWGLVAVGSFAGMNLNIVNLILGSIPVLENIVYLAVGLAAVYKVYELATQK
ncbi:DUF378 domain-containing protein [Candidatus Woesearchaeota archaeon]|nr:DUF378 domain-containing protein [Candidatus Woesearchaeota archaeon]